MRMTTVKRTAMGLGVLAAMLLVTSVALAQEGDGYDLSWSTVDGGGFTFSSGGGYELGGTVGQHDAGSMSGGDYVLSGGFWCGGALQPEYPAYLPLALKRYPR
jgi:hypothetical protein